MVVRCVAHMKGQISPVLGEIHGRPSLLNNNILGCKCRSLAASRTRLRSKRYSAVLTKFDLYDVITFAEMIELVKQAHLHWVDLKPLEDCMSLMCLAFLPLVSVNSLSSVLVPCFPRQSQLRSQSPVRTAEWQVESHPDRSPAGFKIASYDKSLTLESTDLLTDDSVLLFNSCTLQALERQSDRFRLNFSLVHLLVTCSARCFTGRVRWNVHNSSRNCMHRPIRCEAGTKQKEALNAPEKALGQNKDSKSRLSLSLEDLSKAADRLIDGDKDAPSVQAVADSLDVSLSKGLSDGQGGLQERKQKYGANKLPSREEVSSYIWNSVLHTSILRIIRQSVGKICYVPLVFSAITYMQRPCTIELSAFHHW